VSQASFYDRFAARYDELLAATPADRWTRRAFQTLVAETVPPGSLLLDFGCGTGLDALCYAQRGYRVLAYDVSQGMLDRLRDRCASEIARGAVIPVAAPFRGFGDAMARQPRPDAVVANFGVVNALARPGDLFEAVAPLLASGGPLVVSALNPFFWKDMRRGWWWAALRRALAARAGALVTHGDGIDTHRHFVGSLARAARPAFRLAGRASVGALVRYSGGRGALDWDAPRTLPERIEARRWKRFPLRSAGQFIFLVFRRT
jgi:SAM-dependent methyltransferase